MRRWLDRLVRRLLLVTAWMAATLIAGAVAWSPVARLGQDNPAATTPLSQSDVRRDLAQPPTTPASTTGTRQGSTSTSGPPSQSTTATSAGPTTSPGSSGSGPASGPSPTGSADPPATPAQPRRSRFWTLD